MHLSIANAIQCLIISVITLELLRHMASQFGLIDRPNSRKRHTGEIPVIGGIGIFFSLLLSSIVLPGFWSAYAYLLFPAGLMTIVGAVDDIRNLRAGVKLIAQLIIGAIVLGLNPSLILEVPNAGAELGLQALSFALTLLVVVGAVNAMNMMDGIDGLAGGVTCVALGWLLVAALETGNDLVAGMALLLSLPVLAFLFFNARAPWRKRALVFLGDAGSLTLGFMICILGLQLSGHSNGGWSPWALSFIVALPAMDTASLIFRRTYAGRSPLAADREHLHHLLQDAGCTAGQTALLLTAGSAAVGGLGLLLDRLGASTGILICILALFFAGHSVAVAALTMKRKKLKAGAPPSLAGPQRAPVTAHSMVMQTESTGEAKI